MAQQRVVITGMGWVTSLGHDLETVWNALLKPSSGVGPITRFDATTFETNFAAEVKNFSLDDVLGSKANEHKGAGLHSQFALGAAVQAWNQSGLERFANLDRRRMGIYFASGEGPLDFDNFAKTNLASWKPELRTCDARAWAQTAAHTLVAEREVEQEPNLALTHLAGAFDCRGPAFNCLTACAASNQAIGEAADILRRGDADVMFAGGAHSMIHPLGLTGFIRLTACSRRRESPQTAARPFDATRDGFVMGEGSGVLILETLEHALARGATPLAEIAGYGSSADAYRVTDMHPDGRGAKAAMELALKQAGIDARKPGVDGRPQVHYISAHGTGTKENDRIETRAIKAVFGDLAPRVPISSVKSMLGHCIAAAGGVEMITCVLAIRTGILPPTLNLHNPDPECDLDYVPNAPRDVRASGGVNVCLSNSFGFGGQNDTVVVKRFVK
jgi:3-oxoacyl-[acyl-carrier-protein] synthase II